MGTALRHPNGLVPVAAALTLMLAACTSPAPEPTPTSSPVATPVFASDEEALTAAEKAYADYLAVSDEIAQDGGADPERLRDVATGMALSDGLADAQRYSDAGYRGVGRSTFDGIRLQSRPLGTPTQVRAYLCLDVSNTEIVDESGATVVATPDAPRTPLEVSFEIAEEGRDLLVSDSALWDGAGVC